MQLLNWMKAFELPLLKRELIESSRRRRTYVLRFLIAVVLAFVGAISWSTMASSRVSPIARMGHGLEIILTLYITDLIIIYVLLPALACSAISAEREKQTLGLILISRISPGGLVLEKLLSRLVPVFGLILITSPLLALGYVLGGVSASGLLILLLGLLTAAVQVASAAIMCSSLLRTTLDAFWSTYLVLLSLLLVPLVLYWTGIVPEFSLVKGFLPDQPAGIFVLFMPIAAAAAEGSHDLLDFLAFAIWPWCMAALMLVVSRIAIARCPEAAPLDPRKLARRVPWLWLTPTIPLRWMMGILRGLRGEPSLETTESAGSDSVRSMPVREPPVTQPIAWRELQASVLTRWQMHVAGLALLLLFEFLFLSRDGMSEYDLDLTTALFDFTAFIIAILIMLGITCRTFASERERQTLDLLLTTPVTNRIVLSEKLAAANRLTWLLTAWLVCLGVVRMLVVTHNYRSGAPEVSSGWSRMSGLLWWFQPTPTWWVWTLRYLFGVVAHSLLYLTLAKWISVLFSLRFNTLMKAMTGSVISIILLCTALTAIGAFSMALMDANPDDFPGWWFSSPVLIFVLNEFHNLSEVYDFGTDIAQDYIVLLGNLAIYGSLTLLFRALVQRQLARLLNRRDDVTPSDA